MADLITFGLSIAALTIAAWSLWESRKRGKLLESIAESLRFLNKQGTRKRNADYQLTTDVRRTEQQKFALAQQAEERRKLKLKLEEEKLKWHRQKDMAKAIGWIVDRLNEDE